MSSQETEAGPRKKAVACGCEGSCPVCQLGEIRDHLCETCMTEFCSNCHGIKKAIQATAYDQVQRCRCGEIDERRER